MRKKLNTKLIENLPPAEGKRYEVYDELLGGFHVRVCVGGGKVWYLSTRVDRRLRRIKLGTFPVLSLKDAREKAQGILRDIQLGTFQQKEAEEYEKIPTLGELIPQFIERYAKRATRDWKGTQSVLMRMEGLHPYPVDQIKRRQVVYELERMIQSIEGTGGRGTRANRGLAAIKKLYSWCIDQGIVEISPVAGMKPLIKEVARERWLSDDEICRFWAGAGEQGYPFGPFLKMLLLTAQRRDEIAGLRWSEVDFAKGTITFKGERTKNKTLHILPLSSQALAVLRSVPRFLGSEYVFTTTGRSSVSGFGRLKDRVDEHVGLEVEGWRFHDLRRTAATGMAVLRVPPHIIEAVLNHKSGIISGVASVYNRYAYFDEKREAMQAWGNHVEKLITEGQRTLLPELQPAALARATA